MKRLTIASIGMLFASCAPSSPPSIAASDENVTDFNLSGDQLNMRLQFDSDPNSELLASDLEETIGNIAGAIAVNDGNEVGDTKFVSFDIRTGSPEAPERFGNYRFEISAFTDAEGSARPGSHVLNSVRDVETGSGQTVVQFVRWCALRSEEARRLSGFCDRVAASWAIRG